MLVLLNKMLRISPITIGRTNVQNSLDFLTALLVDRHKRGRLRHHRGNFTHNHRQNQYSKFFGFFDRIFS
jgi:hypothetical protein